MADELPLTETTLFILLSLVRGGKHGYAIMQDVSELSDTRVQLSTGTLYGALKRLLEQNWISPGHDEDAGVGGRERKVYELTGEGRRILHAESKRLQQVAQIAQTRLKGRAL